jgi:hypothetical protein
MPAAVFNEQSYRQRECVHRKRGARGGLYDGRSYVQSLQRLRARAAAEFATRVASFYWADADRIVVWLCDECAAALPALKSRES